LFFFLLSNKYFNYFPSADNEAVDIKWEIIDDDQEIEVHKPTDKDPLGIKTIKQSSFFF